VIKDIGYYFVHLETLEGEAVWYTNSQSFIASS